MLYKMKNFSLNNAMLSIILHQRNELLSTFQKKVRKLFGRFFFTNLFIYFGYSKEKIEQKYFNICKSEFLSIKKYLPRKLNYTLSIGCGMGGIEFFLSSAKGFTKLDLVDRNFISKKVVYGFNISNSEAYNDLDCTRDFLLLNKFPKQKFKVYDFDQDKLPVNKYALIVSLKSLDFHYPFSIYKDYIKKVSNLRTVLILDTNRPDYFRGIYKKVIIIKKVINDIHPYCRIYCQGIII